MFSNVKPVCEASADFPPEGSCKFAGKPLYIGAKGRTCSVTSLFSASLFRALPIVGSMYKKNIFFYTSSSDKRCMYVVTAAESGRLEI